jgi:hypothetical protein
VNAHTQLVDERRRPRVEGAAVCVPGEEPALDGDDMSKLSRRDRARHPIPIGARAAAQRRAEHERANKCATASVEAIVTLIVGQ